jgi:hypothetical protein
MCEARAAMVAGGGSCRRGGLRREVAAARGEFRHRPPVSGWRVRVRFGRLWSKGATFGCGRPKLVEA